MTRFLTISLLVLLIVSLPEELFSQDILYRKNSSSIKVEIKDFNGKTVIYQIPGDSSKINFHLSKSVLDSLRYSDGRSLDFTVSSYTPEFPGKMVSRNNISAELVNLFTGIVNIEYERINRIGNGGFVAGLFVNTRTNNYNYWFDHPGAFAYANYNPHYFFIRVGYNFYPFNNSLIKTGISGLSHGFSLLMGSYKKISFETYDPYYSPVMEPVLASSLMWNIKERLYLGDHFQVSAGLEVSVLPFLTFFCPQATLAIGF